MVQIALALRLLLILLSGIGLFLSLWIVLPASTMTLLPLAVGAPEVSLWLLLGNGLLLLVWAFWDKGGLTYWLLGLTTLALILSSLPLLQLPAAVQQAELAMQPYVSSLAPVPGLRPQPFVWVDALLGIALPPVRHSSVQFAAPAGVPLTLEIDRPMQPGLNPTLIVIYGGAWRSGSPKSNSQFNQYMAGRGYTVIAIDYRHAPQHHFPAQLTDVETALKFIRDHAAEYEVDPNRVALLGRSAGAHLALLAGYSSDILPIRAVVDYYGPVDLAKGYYDPPRPDPIDTTAVLRAFIGGSPTEYPELYRQASPIYAVKPGLPPTLLIYGGRDHVVRPEYGKALYRLLLATQNKAVLIEIPWAEHAFDAIFSGPSNQLALYYTERFLQALLQK
jgi:acetyl esterase/lipase